MNIMYHKITEEEKIKFLGKQCYYQYLDGTWSGGEKNKTVFNVIGVDPSGYFFELVSNNFTSLRCRVPAKQMFLTSQTEQIYTTASKNKQENGIEESLNNLQNRLDRLTMKLEYIADYLEKLNKKFDDGDNDDEVLDLMNK